MASRWVDIPASTNFSFVATTATKIYVYGQTTSNINATINGGSSFYCSQGSNNNLTPAYIPMTPGDSIIISALTASAVIFINEGEM